MGNTTQDKKINTLVVVVIESGEWYQDWHPESESGEYHLNEHPNEYPFNRFYFLSIFFMK